MLFLKNDLLNWKIFEEKSIVKSGFKNDENNTNLLSKDVVDKFINIWYKEISQDEKFPVESEVLITSTLKRLGEALYFMDKKHFTYAISNIFLKHLKEFRRTLKIKEKNGTKVSDLYRYSFSEVPNGRSCEYYIDQMTKKLLVNFIHWELWNSIPCKLLVSIISSKIFYLIELCSNPEFLNYYLLRSLLTSEQIADLELCEFTHIKLDSSGLKKDIQNILLEEEYTYQEESISSDNGKKDINVTHREDETDSSINLKTEDVSKDLEISHKTRSDIVKVYEPKSSNEKWNETLDLTSVTLGEDPLQSPSQNKTIIEAITLKDGKNDVTSRQGDATVNTLRDIKDFQENTVNTVVKPMSQATSQALHKIGDFQVGHLVDQNSNTEISSPKGRSSGDGGRSIRSWNGWYSERFEADWLARTLYARRMSDNNKSLLDLEEVDGFIPSIYKVCAKTATGVFNNTLNTIKTALPATDEEMITYGTEKWEFENIDEKGMCLTTRMSKLLQERKDFCMIETAYDAFDSQEPQMKLFVSDVFLDETDYFESRVPLARTVTDIVCELIADSDSLVSQEPFVKFLLLVLGKSVDNVIISKVEDLFNNLSLNEVSKSQDRKVLTMEFDIYVEYLISALPDALNLLASHSTLKDAIGTFILSMQMKKCNEDVILQIFDFMVLRFIEDNCKTNIS